MGVGRLPDLPPPPPQLTGGGCVEVQVIDVRGDVETLRQTCVRFRRVFILLVAAHHRAPSAPLRRASSSRLPSPPRDALACLPFLPATRTIVGTIPGRFHAASDHIA